MKTNRPITDYTPPRSGRRRTPVVQLSSRRRQRKRRNELMLLGGIFVGFVLCIGGLALSGSLTSGSGMLSAPPLAAEPTSTSIFVPPASVQPGGVEPTTEPLAGLETATLAPTEPAATLQHGSVYTVLSGDTLWSISISLGIPMEVIVAANPGLDPNTLYPGDTLSIPRPGDTAEGAPKVFGYVATEGESLRLRSSPGVGNNIVALLEPATVLEISGRSADFYWLHVTVPTGEVGWVDANWVGVPVSLAEIPIEGQAVALALPTATVAPITVTPEELPAATAFPTSLPSYEEQVTDYLYISGITTRSHEIFMAGQAMGNRPNVFSKVGDSITDNAAFLKPIGVGNYNLRAHAYLQPVIDYYSQEIARDANSFANTSLAAKGGWSVWHEFNVDSANTSVCLDGETPLVCEYRVVQPSVALIMLGTNDVMTMSPGKYEEYMRQVIETSIDMGVIPVVSTIPDFYYQDVGNKVQVMNDIIIGLAQEYQVPLWNYWASMQELTGKGLSMDGIHPSWAVPADFTPNFLKYGMTNRNLTALQALDAVWRLVIVD
ncbi:MAG: LysM peptidoglycan-binding domain-containing protein [Anaerolineae bacterium]|nr:LysM peptidoglycan-binding domain-containing protein [Anaerolineae bacterium]